MTAPSIKHLRRTRDGLSVMETLVAVALIAIALAPLYQLQRTLADASIQLEDTAQRLEAEESALDFIAAINPMERPEGELDLGQWSMRWESRVIDEERPADGYVGGFAFDVALYEVTVTLERQGRARELKLRRLGWSRRPVDPDSF